MRDKSIRGRRLVFAATVAVGIVIAAAAGFIYIRRKKCLRAAGVEPIKDWDIHVIRPGKEDFCDK